MEARPLESNSVTCYPQFYSVLSLTWAVLAYMPVSRTKLMNCQRHRFLIRRRSTDRFEIFRSHNKVNRVVSTFCTVREESVRAWWWGQGFDRRMKVLVHHMQLLLLRVMILVVVVVVVVSVETIR